MDYCSVRAHPAQRNRFDEDRRAGKWGRCGSPRRIFRLQRRAGPKESAPTGRGAPRARLRGAGGRERRRRRPSRARAVGAGRDHWGITGPPGRALSAAAARRRTASGPSRRVRRDEKPHRGDRNQLGNDSVKIGTFVAELRPFGSDIRRIRRSESLPIRPKIRRTAR